LRIKKYTILSVFSTGKLCQIEKLFWV
jgi:hypothetical protein